MALAVEYRGKYPRSGEVALLCEGDLIGYEARLFGRWSLETFGTKPLVDVWPCGTGHAIFGMSDSIGRARPILVIEDNDFRTEDEAAADCKSNRRDRENRGVCVLGWHALRRNEIENYFLEPEVLVPVLATAFGANEAQVQDALAEILPALVVFQAAQYALFRARRTWEESDPAHILPQMPQNVSLRPRWTGSQPRISPPDRNAVRAIIAQNLAQWQSCFASTGGSAVQGAKLTDDFDAKCEEWDRTALSGTIWRTAWAGKEVLQWLRIWLTGTIGWRGADGNLTTVKWDGLSRTKTSAIDRPIEDALRPLLVEQFLQHLKTLNTGDIADEWRVFGDAIRTWAPA